MGKATGRKNKSTSDPRQSQETASCEPSTVTTRLSVFLVGDKWTWSIEDGGQTIVAGTRPASGAAMFNERDHAVESMKLNHNAVRVMLTDQRRRERAALSATTQPSPG